jgi:hypothetical protein
MAQKQISMEMIWNLLLEMNQRLSDLEKANNLETGTVLPGNSAYWARIGKAVKDNPDLPVNFVIDLLDAKDEIARGEIEPFTFG